MEIYLDRLTTIWILRNYRLDTTKYNVLEKWSRAVLLESMGFVDEKCVKLITIIVRVHIIR